MKSSTLKIYDKYLKLFAINTAQAMLISFFKNSIDFNSLNCDLKFSTANNPECKLKKKNYRIFKSAMPQNVI